ncbi:response regulator [Persicimonas caeni]|uniref:response regulator n=1 Tax=Persicimonas caeni TaxID=2292766 RepID=UPI00143D4C2D|nr:response regulator [Persicimonas caeni]
MSTKILQHILLVDDDEHIRAISTLALSRVGGYDVEVASGGEEALAQIAQAEPDLVLLDAMMPGTDGRDVLVRLDEQGLLDSLCVVMLTARAQPEEVRGYRELGAFEVITKPFDPMTLADRIRKIWETYSAHEIEESKEVAALYEELRDIFMAKFEERIGRMRQQVGALGDGGAALEGLYMEAHRLAGSAATYGFVEAGRVAIALEEAIAPMRGQGEVLSDEQVVRLSALVDRLQAAASH